MSDHSELVRRLHVSLCRKFIDNAWDAVVNGVVKNYGSTPRDIVEAWFSSADEERIEAANAIEALQAQIARLHAATPASERRMSDIDSVKVRPEDEHSVEPYAKALCRVGNNTRAAWEIIDEKSREGWRRMAQAAIISTYAKPTKEGDDDKEGDEAIAEIGKDVWNEAIAVTLRTIPQPLTTSHVAWLTYQNAIKAVARLKR